MSEDAYIRMLTTLALLVLSNVGTYLFATARARRRGVIEGYARGKDEGYDDGRDIGWREGRAKAYDEFASELDDTPDPTKATRKHPRFQ